MNATIYHNPACSNSRKTLALLEEAGAEVSIREYLKTPLSRPELEQLFGRAGIRPGQALRGKEALARELGLGPATSSDDAVLDAMAAHPVLLERPIVETDKGVALCRPPETVQTLL